MANPPDDKKPGPPTTLPPRVAPLVPPVAPRMPQVTAPPIPSIAPVVAPPAVPRTPTSSPSVVPPRIGPATLPSVQLVAPPGAPRIGATVPVIPPPGAPRVGSSPSVPAIAPPRLVAPPGAPKTGELPTLARPGTGELPTLSRQSVIVPPPPPGPAAASRPSGLFPATPSSMPAVPPAVRPPSSSPSGLTSATGVLLKPSPLPATGSIGQLTPAQTTELARLALAIDSEDYFQVLQVPQSAAAADVKRAFYRESRVYHPDRVFHLTDATAKDHINTIYKRVTEAYYVLRDDAKRRKYLADITGPERLAKLRFSETSEAEQKAEAKKAVEDEFGTNPKSRQFFKTALSDISNQNWVSAERNLKMGLTYEPTNQKFKERLVEVQRKIEEVRKNSGDAFRIK